MDKVVLIEHLDNSSNIYLPSEWNSIEDYKNKIQERLKTFVVENKLLIFLFTQDIMDDEKLQRQTLDKIKSIAKKTGPKYDMPVIIIKIKDRDGNKIKGDLPNKLQQLNKIAKITKWDQFTTNPQIIIDAAVQKWQGHVEKQTTHVKDEHYVAQSYLKNFSKDQIHIWEYDLDKRFAEHYPEIEEVCNIKHLYEFRDSQNNVIAPNSLERLLQVYENKFLEILPNIQKKISLYNSRHCEHFLTNKEASWLIIITCVQLLRHPKSMDAIALTTEEHCKKYNITKYDELSKQEKNNLTLSFALPFLQETSEFDQLILIPLLKELCTYSIYIIACTQECLITCDNPAIFERSPTGTNMFERVYMPLTPKIGLALIPNKQKQNKLILLDNKETLSYNNTIAMAANEYIYAKQRIPKKQIEQLLKIRGKNNRMLQKYLKSID